MKRTIKRFFGWVIIGHLLPFGCLTIWAMKGQQEHWTIPFLAGVCLNVVAVLLFGLYKLIEWLLD